MMEVQVFEHNSPLLTFRLKKLVPGGPTIPYDLTGTVSEIKMFVKNNSTDPDSTPRFAYTKTGGQVVITADGSALGATYSEITVQVNASDTATPGTYYYHIDVTKLARVETVSEGYFTVADI